MKDGCYFPPSESQGGWRSLVQANQEPAQDRKAIIRTTTGLDWDRLHEVWRYCNAILEGQHSVLVIRHGWVAAEWRNYAQPKMGVCSCSKALTGLAMAKVFDMSDAGLLPKRIGIDDEAWRLLPPAWAETDPARRRITLRHMLTMTSGLEPYDGACPDAEYLALILGLPVEAEPGKVWAYTSAAVDLLSLAIEDVTGRTLEQMLNEEVHQFIGAPPSRWNHFHGHSYGCGGAHYEPRELARIGYLVLHEGAWGTGKNRRQIISAARIAECTRHAGWLESTKKREPNFADEPHPQDYYGHLWWTNITGEALGDAAPRDAVYMSGSGKQACFVVPSLDMVVVRLGPERELNRRQEFYPELWGRLMAAVV
jgi:CubicO group peptidase (beta-lactamase class C family)